MFGLFGQSKFLKLVYGKVRFFIAQSGVELTNNTFEKIKSEIILNRGEDWDEGLSFRDVVAESIDNVVWEKRDYLYGDGRFTENQAAIFCISEYVFYLGQSGKLKALKDEERDMFLAMQMLWEFCQSLAKDPGTAQNYARAVVHRDDFTDLVG